MNNALTDVTAFESIAAPQLFADAGHVVEQSFQLGAASRTKIP